MGCINVTSLYDSKSHRGNLEAVISEQLLILETLSNTEKEKYTDELGKTRTRKKDITSTFYSNLLNSLLKSDKFRCKYDSKSDKITQYDESIRVLLDNISEIVSSFAEKFKLGDAFNYQQFVNLLYSKDTVNTFGVVRLSAHTFDLDEKADVSNDNFEKTKDVTKESYEDFRKKMYGLNSGADINREQKFLLDMFGRTIMNIEDGFTIQTTLELNDQMKLYKNELYDKILDYLYEVRPDNTYPSNIYDESDQMRVSSGYQKALLDMKSILEDLESKDLLDDKLEADFRANQLGENTSGLLEALDAYVNLAYFDNVLEDTVGKYISYDKSYKNKEVSKCDKYQYGHDFQHQVRTWNVDGDARTAVLNTSKFSKVVLGFIPLISNSSLKSNQTVGVTKCTFAYTQLFAAINKIKYLKNDNKKNSVKELIDLMLKFHDNPVYYAGEITRLVSSNETIQTELKRVGISDSSINVFKSLYKFIFAFAEGDERKSVNYSNVKHKSVRTVESRIRQEQMSVGKYSILDDIASLIDDCMDATYTYSRYSEGGEYELGIRKKYADRRDSEKFKSRVSNRVATLPTTVREQWGKDCKIVFESDLKSLSNPTITIKQSSTVTIDSDGFERNISNDFVLNSESQELQLKFDVGNGTLGILTQTDKFTITPTNKSLELWQNIIDIFTSDWNDPSNVNRIDLASPDTVSRLINGKDLSEAELNFRSILNFIDERLNTQFLSRDGLLKFSYFRDTYDNERISYLQELLFYSVKALVASNIYDRYETFEAEGSLLDFDRFLKQEYPIFRNVIGSKDLESTYFTVTEGQYQLNVIPSSTTWVDNLMYANTIVSGDDISSTSKNQEKNNDANYTTSYYGGLLQHTLYKYRLELYDLDLKSKATGESRKVLATTHLLFTLDDNHRSIESVIINSDVRNRAGTVKSTRNLKSSELFYNAIFHNFWGSYIKNGTYNIQPTTYSDKVKFLQYAIKGDYKFKLDKPRTIVDKDGKVKTIDSVTLDEMTTDDIISLFHKTIGNSHKQLYNNVLDTYRELFNDYSLSALDIDRLISAYSEDALTRKAHDAGIKLKMDTHYRVINGKCRINELIDFSANTIYKDVLSTKKLLKQQETAFVNDLVSSGMFIYTGYSITASRVKNYKSTDTTNIRENENEDDRLNKLVSYISDNQISQKPPVMQAIHKLFGSNRAAMRDYLSKWVEGDKLVLAKTADGKNVLSDLVSGEVTLNPLLEKFFYIETLLSNNLRLSLTGSEFAHPAKKFRVNVATEIEEIGLDKSVANIQKAFVAGNILSFDGRSKPAGNNFMDYDALIAVGENRDDIINKAKLEGKILVTSDHKVSNYRMFNKELPEGSPYINSKNNIIYKGLTIQDILDLIPTLNTNLGYTKLLNNPRLKSLAENIMNKMISNLQGTLLKRNVIIPATLHYYHRGLLTGIADDINVAYIKDVESIVYNFCGEKKGLDSMDGSSIVNPFQSILENLSLGSQEVGCDKKSIWHSFDAMTMTAGLMKHAAFEINNTRIRQSQGSNISLDTILRKMTNIQWRDAKGWNTNGREILLMLSNQLAGVFKTKKKISFKRDVLNGKTLYYQNLSKEDGFSRIDDFDQDFTKSDVYGTGIYFTEETEVFNSREATTTNGEINPYYGTIVQTNVTKKIYHLFDNSGNHYKLSEEELNYPEIKALGLHTVNSLYELWKVMGGEYSYEANSNDNLVPSDNSSHAVVGFMNNVVFLKDGGRKTDYTQQSYDQPLKKMMIGYLTNNSAMKEGVENINHSKGWTDEKYQFKYVPVSSSGLGVQMDADHDIETAELTEFSQVITALEAGGRLHKYAKQVYKDLGKVAANASRIELDIIANYIANSLKGEMSYKELRDEIYDIIGRTLINNIKRGNDKADLSREILQGLSKRFGKVSNHLYDKIKIPFSDPNIYNQILTTFVSQINEKSVKRKYPGSGCVMVPAYNMIQYFNINGRRMMFDDVLREARIALDNGKITVSERSANQTQYAKQLVTAYLEKIENAQPFTSDGNESFIPTDVVKIYDSKGVYIATVDLNDVDDYYNFKDSNWVELFKGDEKIDYKRLLSGVQYKHAVTAPRNLAPARITFKYADANDVVHSMNIFDIPAIKEARLKTKEKQSVNRGSIQRVFDMLKQGLFIDANGNTINIVEGSLNVKAAELVISDMYGSKFRTKGMSVDEIRQKGVEAFRISPDSPIDSDKYDFVFKKGNGNHTYITFDKHKSDLENGFSSNKIPWEETRLKVIRDGSAQNVWYMSKDNRPLFKVGRNILRNDVTYTRDEFDKLHYYDSTGKELTDESAIKNFVPGKNNTVYEYIEVLSRYDLYEKIELDGKELAVTPLTTFYINRNAVKKVILGCEGKELEKHTNRFITSILDNIFLSDLYSSMDLNTKISKAAAISISNCISRMESIQGLLKSECVDKLVLIVNDKLNDPNIGDIKYSDILDLDDLFDLLEDIQNNYYDLYAQERYTSWKLSLYFTAARIPAQTLQSFMLMEAIGYTGSDMNVCHVSTWLTWLLGSDY